MNEKIKELKEKLKITSGNEKVDTFVWLGFLLRFSNTEQAEDYLTQGLDLAKQLNYKKGMASIYRLLMVIQTIKGNPQEATDFGYDALRLFNELDDKKGIADIYNNLGIVYLDNHQLSLEYYLKALKIKKEIGYTQGIGRAYQNIGVLYRQQKEPDRAQEYFEKALNIYEEQNSLFDISNVYGNIGLVYEDKKEYNKAAEYQQKSLQIAEELDDKYYIAASLVNLGNVYNNMGEHDKALECHIRGLQIYEKLQNKNFIAACLINIGNAEAMRQNYDIAIDYLNRGLELAKKTDAKTWIQNAYESLTEVYRMKGDHKKALEYLHLYLEIHDEIFNIEKSRQIALIHTQYETEKKQLRIQHLEQELHIKDESLKQFALSFSQINEFIDQTMTELEKIANTKASKRNILDKINTLTKECRNNEIFWQDFSNFFNEIHGDFIQHLTERFPELTPREIQICTLLRTNLSSKEIAEALYLSVRTVGEYRYRIRSKLRLDHDSNLTAFLLSI
jgi:tetratricopeptide (TPR) repeat protein/DNA-binding CsgD family transcriptional regulator